MRNRNMLLSKMLLFGFLCIPVQLMAQSMDGSFAIDYGSVLINSPQNLIRRLDNPPDSESQKSAPSIAPQSMAFSPSKTQRKKNIATYISSVAKVAPDYAPELAAEFADGAVFDQYGQMLGSLGLDANDVGDNMAVWWITAWEASMGRPVDTPPAAFAKVKAQVGRILSEKALVAMNNTEKQSYADSMVIQTLVLANQIEQAKSNPEIAQKLAAGIKAGAKKNGL